jgi:4,5:9,10-diseco-3-hydroxy-5,9,17-trioxoandrosta-1(10),2-diene-4-oate hydrolase
MNHMVAASAKKRSALDAPEPVTWVDAGGTRLAAMRRGRGKPVVCLHAIAHGARDFEAFAELAGDGFEIIALDWPGHGLSPDDGKPPSVAHYSRLLRCALDALDLERPILLGNSIGGGAALRIAALHPDRVGGLVLCDSAGLMPINVVTRFLIGRFVAFFRAGEKGRRWFGPAYRFYYNRVLPMEAAHEERARIVAAGYEMAPLLRQAFESFAGAEVDLREDVAHVRCPVFVAWASNDRVLAWSQSRKAAQAFHSGTIELFPGGHAAFLENPQRFVESFRAFARAVKG